MKNKKLSIEEIAYMDCCEDCPRARICHERVETCDTYDERLEELKLPGRTTSLALWETLFFNLDLFL